MPTDSDLYGTNPATGAAPSWSTVTPTNPFGNTLSKGGLPMFSNLDVKDTVAGSGLFADETPITDVNKLDPLTRGVIETNDRGNRINGRPMTAQEYLDARGGLWANGYGDNRAATQLTAKEMAGLDGTAASYNDAKMNKIRSAWAASPANIADPVLKQFVLSGQITADQAASLYIDDWGKNSDMHQVVQQFLQTQQFNGQAKDRDLMVEQMKAKGYTQSMIDAQVQASYPQLLAWEKTGGAVTGGTTYASQGGYDANGNYVGAGGEYNAAGTNIKTGTASGLTKDQQNAIAALKTTFSQYGLDSLYGKIEGYVKDGYTADTVAMMLRTTDEYKQRFPAMATLAAKGRAINEASYINYETTAAQFEQQYGLPKGMLTGNVTKLLENDISPVEMQERVQLASANSLMAPPELRQTLQNYYGIGDGGLTAYFLDPAVAAPLLQKHAAAAQIGAAGLQQGIGVDMGTAEGLTDLGVTQSMAQQGFQQIAAAQELTTGAGDTTTNKEMTAGILGQDQNALRNVQRAEQSRVARFQGGGQYAADRSGVVGLGSAATS